jgi:hypothetical protein
VATASLPLPTMMSLVTSVVGAAPCGAPITGLLPAAPETVGLAAGGVGLVLPTVGGAVGLLAVGLLAVASFDTDLAPHPVSVERVNKIERKIKVAFFVRVIIRFQSL